eukprot:4454202-Prymnesium_polylepis.1
MDRFVIVPATRVRRDGGGAAARASRPPRLLPAGRRGVARPRVDPTEAERRRTVRRPTCDDNRTVNRQHACSVRSTTGDHRPRPVLRSP